MQYRHTHYSVRDGSPAMLVDYTREHNLVLENEDGYRWVGTTNEWLPYLDESEVKTCPPTHILHDHESDAPK